MEQHSNILIVNTDLPIFPGAAGHEFLMTTNLAAFARTVGLVSMAHRRHDLDLSHVLSDAGVRLYLWQSPFLDGAPPAAAPRRVARWVLRAAQAVWAAGRAGRARPVDTVMTDAAFSNMAPQVIRALSERTWHVLTVVQSSAAAMLDYIPKPLVSVLVMHDIRARLYERRADSALSWLDRWRSAKEARRYRRFEHARCQEVDLVVTVSDEDARWVREHYAPRRLFAAPIPVDTTYFAPTVPGDDGDHRIVFTGHLSHPPNIDAAVYFAEDVFPRVRVRLPSAEFHIVGRSPLDPVKELARLPGVRLFADVPDIRTHIGGAAVVVAPLRYGSGSRNKILEAWGMEKCVVATTIGAEGLDCEPGTNVLLADGSAALADAVVGALSQPEMRSRLGRAGRQVACRDHDPKRLAARYFAEVEQVCREKAAADVPMRVLLDLRWMVPGLAGGLENLARSFLAQLAALDSYNAYVVLAPAQCRHEFDLRRRPNFRVESVDSAGATVRRHWARVASGLAARAHMHNWRTPDVRLLQWLRALRVDIGYSFPGYIHPELYPLRNVLVVPDIQHEYLPEFFTPAALEERRRLYTDSIARAHHICAISEFTRQTLAEKLGTPLEKVTTVSLAADPIFSMEPAHTAADSQTLAKYGLQAGGYFYFPAHTWHHKNHVTAIESLRILRDRHGLTPTLVCSGGAREAQPAIDARISAAGLGNQVRFLGYCPRPEVPALYRRAAGLLFPSLFEGFGMPVLEAMASGCPVVCSNTTSLPEIAGDAAVLVDPKDAEALAAAGRDLLTCDELRHRLISVGRRQAQRFSWRRHTLETLAVLRRVQAEMRTV